MKEDLYIDNRSPFCAFGTYNFIISTASNFLSRRILIEVSHPFYVPTYWDFHALSFSNRGNRSEENYRPCFINSALIETMLHFDTVNPCYLQFGFENYKLILTCKISVEKGNLIGKSIAFTRLLPRRDQVIILALFNAYHQLQWCYLSKHRSRSHEAQRLKWCVRFYWGRPFAT